MGTIQVIRSCAYCKKDLEIYAHNSRKYCDKKCKQDVQNKRRRLFRKLKTMGYSQLTNTQIATLIIREKQARKPISIFLDWYLLLWFSIMCISYIFIISKLY